MDATALPKFPPEVKNVKGTVRHVLSTQGKAYIRSLCMCMYRSVMNIVRLTLILLTRPIPVPPGTLSIPLDIRDRVAAETGITRKQLDTWLVSERANERKKHATTAEVGSSSGAWGLTPLSPVTPQDTTSTKTASIMPSAAPQDKIKAKERIREWADT